ncbi:MAG: hypothetical protein ABH811_02450 [archaeon]
MKSIDILDKIILSKKFIELKRLNSENLLRLIENYEEFLERNQGKKGHEGLYHEAYQKYFKTIEFAKSLGIDLSNRESYSVSMEAELIK